MRWIAPPLLLTTMAATFAVGYTPPSFAQSTNGAALSRSIPDSWEGFRPPDRIGSPDGREGGATRSPDQSCVPGKTPLTALLPESKVVNTISPYPTFFWYLPQTSAKAVEFVLLDGEQEVYRSSFAIDGTARVAALSLPKQALLTPLEVGKTYEWKLALICNPQERGIDIVIGGEIKRVAPNSSLANKINGADLQEQLSLYAESRLWHETLETLMKLQHSNNPTTKTAASNAWKKLLKSVGLDKVASEGSALSSR